MYMMLADLGTKFCVCAGPAWVLTLGASLTFSVCSELVPLTDRVASSLEYMESHLERVRKLNEGRGKHGRFVLGENISI